LLFAFRFLLFFREMSNFGKVTHYSGINTNIQLQIKASWNRELTITKKDKAHLKH
jgi:hypothetical protein